MICHVLMQGLWSPAAWARAELTVRLLKWRYPTLSGGTERLFQPPIARQRHAFVAAALRRGRARSFVDLGCGDGKLLEYLVTQVRKPPPPQTLCGQYVMYVCVWSCSTCMRTWPGAASAVACFSFCSSRHGVAVNKLPER